MDQREHAVKSPKTEGGGINFTSNVRNRAELVGKQPAGPRVRAKAKEKSKTVDP